MDGVVVLDLETQELVPENRDYGSMHVSYAGIRTDERVSIYAESQLSDLFKRLDTASLIVGHNILLFDYRVLQRYAQFDVVKRYREKTFDIFNILLRKTDRRISLGDLAERNIGMTKNGKGSDAPDLYARNEHDALKAYLTQDLDVTAALFEHIRAHGSVKYGHIVYKEPIEREILISIDER